MADLNDTIKNAEELSNILDLVKGKFADIMQSEREILNFSRFDKSLEDIRSSINKLGNSKALKQLFNVIPNIKALNAIDDTVRGGTNWLNEDYDGAMEKYSDLFHSIIRAVKGEIGSKSRLDTTWMNDDTRYETGAAIKDIADKSSFRFNKALREYNETKDKYIKILEDASTLADSRLDELKEDVDFDAIIKPIKDAGKRVKNIRLDWTNDLTDDERASFDEAEGYERGTAYLSDRIKKYKETIAKVLLDNISESADPANVADTLMRNFDVDTFSGKVFRGNIDTLRAGINGINKDILDEIGSKYADLLNIDWDNTDIDDTIVDKAFILDFINGAIGFGTKQIGNIVTKPDTSWMSDALKKSLSPYLDYINSINDQVANTIEEYKGQIASIIEGLPGKKLVHKDLLKAINIRNSPKSNGTELKASEMLMLLDERYEDYTDLVNMFGEKDEYSFEEISKIEDRYKKGRIEKLLQDDDDNKVSKVGNTVKQLKAFAKLDRATQVGTVLRTWYKYHAPSSVSLAGAIADELPKFIERYSVLPDVYKGETKSADVDEANAEAAEAAKAAEEERARLAAEAAEREQKEKEAIEAKAKAEEEHRQALEREKKAQDELAKATAEANKATETGGSVINSEYADNIKAAQEEAAKASEDLARSNEAVKQATENAARASEAAVNAKKAEADATEKVKKANDDLTEATKKSTDAKAKNVEASKSETNSAKEILDETKRYVSDQESLTNRKMPFAEQAKYYEEQLKKLKYGTREYIDVLKMKNTAENAAVKESKANRDKVLSTIKSISGAINNAVNKIISIIRSGIRIINKVVSTAGNIVTRVVSGVRRIIQVFGGLSNRVRQSLGIANNNIYSGNKALNLLKGTATELDSKLNLLSRAYNAIFNNQLINDAKELQASVYSLQNIVGKEQTQEVIDWANAYEYAFGLSAKQLIADINELTGVLYGLGIKSEHVGVASENILVASRYLAFMGAAGSDTDKVMEKLLSGIKGMTQSIDDLGISVRSAQMDTFLKKLKDQGGEFANIGTSFENLNEEARIYVRYASVIDQITSRYDLTRFTGALTTTTGSLSLLKETVNTLRLTVGVGLNNIIAKLSTYIIPLVSYVNDLIVRIFSHFGIDTKLSTNINKGVDAFGNISVEADKAKDSLDAVSEASKKAGGNLQSFDRINNVTTSKSGSGSGSDGFDYSKLFTSGIDKLNKLAFEAQESYMDRLKKKLKDDTASLVNEIKSRLNEITGREINLGFDMATIRGNLQSIFNHIKDTLKTWGTFVINIGVKIADDMNIGLIITKLSTLIERFTALGRTVAEVVTPILDRFYENTLKPIFESLGISAVGLIDKLILKTTEAENKVLSADWSESFSNTLDSLFTKVEQFFGVLTRTKSETVLDETAGTSWGLFLSVLDAFLQVGEALAPIISDLAKEFGAFLRDEALPWFIEKLEDLSIWLTENKDKIEEFLRMYGGAAWKAFKMFVEIVGDLIAFCVEHPNEVADFLTALVSIKIASWATNAAAGLMKLFDTFTKFKATKLGAKIFGGEAAEAAGDVLGLPGSTAAGTAGNGIFKTLGATASKFLRKAAGTKVGHLLLGTTGGGLALTAAGIAGLKYDFNNISDYKKVDEKQKRMEEAGLKAIEEGNYALAQEYSKKIDIMEDIQNDIFKRPKQALDDDYVDELYQQWLEEQDILAEQEQVRKENSEKLLEYNNNVTNSAKDTSNSVVQAYSTVPYGVDNSFSTAAKGAKDQLNSIPGGINSNAVAAQYNSLPAEVETIFANTKLAANSQTDGIKTNTASGCRAMTNTFWAYNTAVKTIIESTNRTVNKNFDNINKRADEVLKKYQSLGIISTGLRIGGGGSYKSRFSGLSFNTSTFVPKYETSNYVTKEKTSTLADKVDTAKENTKTRFSFSNTLVNNAYDDTRNRIYARHSQSVLGRYAVGGSIAGGQLFIANEGGEAELIGNIDGTRKTNVANNNMIMEAMSNGVYEAVYNALAEILNQRGFNNNAGSANIRIDGFGLIDQSTLRELARLLAPYLSSNSINIADTGFSI